MRALAPTSRLACVLVATISLGACALPDQRAQSSRALAIVGATVVHPERAASQARSPDTTIIVENERIVAVGARGAVAVPDGAQVVDGSALYVVPGLVDAHVHFFQSGNLYTRPDVADFNAWVSYKDEVARNQARLPATFKVWIASGVTSVVDIGGPFWNFSVRDAAARSDIAPRFAVAGPLISTVDDPPLDLADPQIVAAMGDLDRIPRDILPARVARILAMPVPTFHR